MSEVDAIWRTARALRGVLLPYRATLLIIDKLEGKGERHVHFVIHQDGPASFPSSNSRRCGAGGPPCRTPGELGPGAKVCFTVQSVGYPKP
jgi:hypothetical protein